MTALIRYFEATRDNRYPALFRFISTARISNEQGATFPRDLPGLAAWNAARSGELGIDEIRAVASEAKRVLLAAPIPSDVPVQLAVEFQEFINTQTSEQFTARYIGRIEWALNTPGPDSLRRGLSEKLVTSGRAPSEAKAMACVDLLLAHVLRLLAQPGPKLLVQSDLNTVLSESALSAHDERVLALLNAFAAQTTAQLSTLQTKADEILSSVQGGVAEVLESVASLATHAVVFAPITSDAPPAIDDWIVKRPALVAELGAALAQHSTYALLGPAGMGKTILAALLYNQWPTPRRDWVSLTDLIRSEARRHLLQQLLIHTGAPNIRSMTFGEVAREYARVLGSGLLVVDDVPNTNADKVLARQLFDLVSAVSAVGGHVLLTAHSPLPADVAPPSIDPLNQLTVPALTKTEVLEALVASAVDQMFLAERVVNLIDATTSGHPVLVMATIRYIKSHRDSDPDTLLSIISGEPVKPVRLDTRRRLRELLTEDGRGLVDRLSLLWNRFDKPLAFSLAAVEPAVHNPGEAIEDLRGVWIHTHPKRELELSPLLKGIGSEFLDAAVQQRIHAAAARVYLTAKSITPHRAIEIAFHLINGREWELLTRFLFLIAQRVDSAKDASAFETLPMMFRPTFPDHLGIPLRTRIAFRAVQIRVATLAGGKADVVLSDLRGLSDLVTEDEGIIESFVGWLLVGPFNPGAPAPLSLEATLRAIRLPPRMPIIKDIPAPLEALIWTVIPNIRSARDVDAFVSTVEAMTDSELRRAVSDDQLRLGIEVVAGKCAQVELALPDSERDWSRAVKRLDILAARGRAAGAESIVDAAERQKATVLADFLGEPDRAIEILTADREQHAPAERMRRDHLTAAVLLDQGSIEAALEQYQKALLGPSDEDPFTYADAARRAAEAAARIRQWSQAIKMATRALPALRRAGLEYDRLDLITELAWLCWESGSRSRAAAAMAGVVRGLATSVEFESARYRESFRKAGMLLGWISTLARGQSQPAWGGEPLATPFPGWASRSRPLLSTMSTPMSMPFLDYLLARASELADLHKIAFLQFEKAAASAKADGLSVVERIAKSGEGQMRAAAGDVEGAIPATVFGLRVFAIDQNAEAGGPWSQASVDGAWAALDDDRRRDIEKMLFWEAIAPLLVRGVVRGFDDQAFRGLLQRLRRVIADTPNLEEPDYWNRLVDLCLRAFGGGLTASEIREEVKRNDDRIALMALYLSLMRSSGASLQDVCGSQIVCLATLSEYRVVSPAARDLSRYVVTFWHRAAAERAAAMSAPAAFRMRIAAFTSAGIESAAAVLVAAISATGTSVSGDLRAALMSLAHN